MTSDVRMYTVKNILLDKHPPAQPPIPSALVTHTPPSSPSILFESISPELIRSVALNMSGSSGPSGLDVADWKRLCTSFHSSSKDLCLSLSLLAKRLCTSYVDAVGLHPFLSSRLIAIDKLFGVRPIGVGETVCRIVGKAILRVISPEIMQTAGLFQLCAGQPGGCEAAIHHVRPLFSSIDCEAILLVDASNAFNSLNHQNALRNILSLCHYCYKLLSCRAFLIF